jgi:hypothetical protein
MKINQITETTTAGAIATVSSPLGATQSRSNPSIYGGKKVGTLFKGKKTSAPYANSINESADLSEAELQEDDIIMVPGQGKRLKPGFIAKSADRTDREVEMAKSDLFQAAQNAQKVFAMVKDVSEEEGLEGWVQEKIIKANDYLNTVREYLEGKQYQQESGAGVIAGGIAAEGAKVDRMVKHIEKSEKKLGHSKKEAENIAWATANKRGMLDNKNKKK